MEEILYFSEFVLLRFAVFSVFLFFVLFGGMEERFASSACSWGDAKGREFSRPLSLVLACSWACGVVCGTLFPSRR